MGTWKFPKTAAEIKLLASIMSTHTNAEEAKKNVTDIFGDDELLDIFEKYENTSLEVDMRPFIAARLEEILYWSFIPPDLNDHNVEEIMKFIIEAHKDDELPPHPYHANSVDDTPDAALEYLSKVLDDDTLIQDAKVFRIAPAAYAAFLPSYAEPFRIDCCSGHVIQSSLSPGHPYLIEKIAQSRTPHSIN